MNPVSDRADGISLYTAIPTIRAAVGSQPEARTDIIVVLPWARASEKRVKASKEVERLYAIKSGIEAGASTQQRTMPLTSDSANEIAATNTME